MTTYLEPATECGTPIEIGRDPRTMTVHELNALGHVKRRLLDCVRQNCIDCCAGNSAEVRRCRMVTCPFWPYRMGTNPFHTVEMSDERRANAAARLKNSLRARQNAAVAILPATPLPANPYDPPAADARRAETDNR